MTVLLLAALTLLAVAVYLAAEARTRPLRERRASVVRASIDHSKMRTDATLGPVHSRVGEPVAAALAQLALRLAPSSSLDTVRQQLAAAGLSRRLSPTAFLAGKILFTLGSVGLALAIGLTEHSPLRGLVLALVCCYLGLRLPDFALARKAKARTERITRDMARAIDVLAVSVEAGLAFDGAVVKLLERFDGPLAEELSLMQTEMLVGETREQALRRLAERVPAPEMRTFVQALIQSEQLGISLAKILHVQAAEMRKRRQQAAEEKAMKAPVKMLFPTVLFIFPVMFVVILGPAFMGLSKAF